MAADRGLPVNDGGEGEELRASFDDCDGDVMNVVLPEIRKGEL